MRLILVATLVFSIYSLAKDDNQPGMDREAVRRSIRGVLPEIAKCYEKRSPEFLKNEGKIVVEWDIQGDGSVGKIGIKTSALNAPPVEECVMNQIKTVKFPVPPTETTASVSYPFSFATTK